MKIPAHSISYLLLLFSLMTIKANGQISVSSPEPKAHLAGKPLFWRLTPADSIKLANLPEYCPPYQGMQAKSTFPAVFDNSGVPYFRPLFNDVAYECGQASGVALGFTYELNYKRNSDASLPENQIPTHFVYNFHNQGETYVGVSYFDSWEILHEMGSPSVQDYGGMWIGNSSTRNKKWVSGYDIYYAGMHNRSPQLYSLKVNTPEKLNILKGWIYNHSGNDTVGGVANFYSKFMGLSSMDLLPVGTPEAGKYVVTEWGYSNHGMTIVGWNDSIRFDYNNDGQYTNHIDINYDGVVDMQDWEIGGLIFANTYANPGGNTWGNQGYAYMMYATLAMPYGSGGIWNNAVHLFQAKQNVDPLLTLKINLSHTLRDKLRIYAGVSTDTLSEVPDRLMQFHAFNGYGGEYPMQGGTSPADLFLEFGLDISELLNDIAANEAAKFFFVVEEIDPLNQGEGQIVSCSLMDYTSGTVQEIPFLQTNVPIANDTLSSLSIVYQPVFDKVQINTPALSEATVGSPYIEQLNAVGGTPPYTWHLLSDYSVSMQTDSLPWVTAEQVLTSNYNNGTAGHSLDFDFPFYGHTYDSVVVYNDGTLLFEFDNYAWSYYKSLKLMFKLHRQIAPFLTDIVFNTSSGDGIFYEGDANSATFRWKGYLSGQSSSDVNFAIRLHSNGKIDFYYGDMSFGGNVEWYGGISEGDYDNHVFHSFSGVSSIPANTRVTFDPRKYPEGMELSSDGVLSCTPMQAYESLALKIRVLDNNDLYDDKELNFHTNGFDGLILQSLEIESGGDTLIEYGETTMLSLNMQNLDSTAIFDGQITLSCPDSYLTLTDSISTFVQVPALGTINLSNAFIFEVSSQVPDGHEFAFYGQSTAQNDTSEFFFTLKAFAPYLVMQSVSIVDGGNMTAEAGETVELQIGLKNKGGAMAGDVDVNLSCFDPYISFSTFQFSGLNLAPNNTMVLTFPAQITANAVTGHLVTGDLSVHVPGQDEEHFYPAFMIGRFIEYWEVSQPELDWQYGGNANWFVSSYLPGEGMFSLQSGDIEDNEESWFMIQGNVLLDGTIEFMRKVSCEDDPNNDNYDYLVFTIDGDEMARWDGEKDWENFSYTVSPGYHTFKWIYHKDYSVSSGEDCAWVDSIALPVLDIDWGPPVLAVTASDSIICHGDSIQLFAFPDGVFQGPLTYNWTPSVDLNDATAQNPVAFPEQSNTYQLTVSDGMNNLTATVPITVNPVPSAPDIYLVNGSTLFSNYSFGNYWFDEWGNLLAADEPSFTPTESGFYYAQVMNNYGCFSPPSVSIEVILGLSTTKRNLDVRIYPNPNSGKFILNLPYAGTGFSGTIYNSLKQPLFVFDETIGSVSQAEYRVAIDLNEYVPDLHSGVYFCVIQYPNHVVVKEFVIQTSDE